VLRVCEFGLRYSLKVPWVRDSEIQLNIKALQLGDIGLQHNVKVLKGW
jgi:hypothetical protein